MINTIARNSIGRRGFVESVILKSSSPILPLYSVLNRVPRLNMSTAATVPTSPESPRSRSNSRTRATAKKRWSAESAVPSNIKKLLIPDHPNARINYILAFIQIVRLLKTQKRTGWLDRGIPPRKVESISDHMYRMSIIAMLIPNSNIDLNKCVKVAIVHDIAESLVGDITPFGGVTKEEKHRRELESINYLASLIKPYNPEYAEEILELWLDYEEIRTTEARYVKDIDKYEMIQQAWEYEQEFGLQYDLGEFYDSRSAIVTPEIGELCDEVIAQRKILIQNLQSAQV